MCNIYSRTRLLSGRLLPTVKMGDNVDVWLIESNCIINFTGLDLLWFINKTKVQGAGTK